ncbi:CAP domain-containing protein [Paenibacillus pini]|uniref:Transporter n=1 Tax=Paenibacillus pini JCM 16418 TaxID=1236976 RepID=W7YR32_9BACL|nr:CAP domain-containing protein [Paenibacillus pini]GAF09888.1 transporter [Paenibacillus pini JCM 16418]
MKNNKWMKMVASGAFAAVLGVSLLGTSSASAAACAPTPIDTKSAQVYLQQFLKNNDNLNSLIQKYENLIKLSLKKPEASTPGTVVPDKKPETSTPGTVVPDKKPETSTPGTVVPDKKPEPTPEQPSTSDKSSFAAQVITLVNQERSKAGLNALSENTKLSAMALDKAKDMYNNNYFDHNSPTYGSPFDMMKTYGISYSYAGENIAKGQKTPADVMNAWMNSEGHKANILSKNFTTIGVAYYNGCWVQEFTAN